MQNKCTSCGVKVSSDLSVCPLCGKYLLKEGSSKPEKNIHSYPDYDIVKQYKHRALNILTKIIMDLAVICTIINLFFKTSPYWFPYVVSALIMIEMVFILPLSQKDLYLRSMVKMGVIISLFIIFIDFYNYRMFHNAFGWSLEYITPSILLGINIVSAILCLCLKRMELVHLYGVLLTTLISIIYFIMMFIGFKNLSLIMVIIYMCIACVSSFVLLTIKYKRFASELNRRFHI